MELGGFRSWQTAPWGYSESGDGMATLGHRSGNTKRYDTCSSFPHRTLPPIDVPLAKKPLTGTAQQRLFLVLKIVLHVVVVISEVLHLNKSRCNRCYMAHLCCLLGVFSIPWDPLENASCPLCDGDFSREHLLWDCTIVSKQREESLSHGLEAWRKDLGRLAHLWLGSLSRFLLAIRLTFRMISVEGVSGC